MVALIFQVSMPRAGQAQNEPPGACSGNCLADRGRNPFMRTKLHVFTLFLVVCPPKARFRCFCTYDSLIETCFVRIFVRICIVLGLTACHS